WKPGKSRLLSTMQGKKLFQAHMEPFFTIPRSRIVKLIDLDLYPYKTVSGSGHCSQKLFRKLSRSASKNFFIHAAEWRLAQKLNFLKANSENPDRCFSTGLAMGLGYKNNTRNFLKLYDILKRLTGLSEKELFAYSLGICGFFADGYKKRWAESTYYRGLLDLYEALPVQEVPHIPFLLHQIRPFNHPIRRIAYMIQMLKDPNLPQLSNGMLKAWREQWQKVEHQRAWKKLRGIFEGMIPKYQHSYWNRHFSFCSQPSSKDLPLLGGTVIQEILINAFLPILFEDIAKRGHPKEREAFYNFYASFPASRTSKSLYLKQRFFGDSLKGDLMKTAEIEQGAYQLHHDFCIHYEASCEGCPFIERYTGR
ncbi:MAG: DUF2851 family protein, partial [Waddliaceae bacterium]